MTYRIAIALGARIDKLEDNNTLMWKEEMIASLVAVHRDRHFIDDPDIQHYQGSGISTL